MSHVTHHAIVVTTWSADLAKLAHAEATRIFGEQVSSIVGTPVNEYWTFIVGPDGSKEGWQESDDGDRRRAEFIAWMNAQRYEDGSTSLRWFEVRYGEGLDEDGHEVNIATEVTASSVAHEEPEDA